MIDVPATALPDLHQLPHADGPNDETARWAIDRAADMLDRALPWLNRLAAIGMEHGGPGPDELLQEPGAAPRLLLALEAEELLFQLQQVRPADGPAQALALDLDDALLREDHVPAPPPADPLLAAALALAAAHERHQAHRIVGTPSDAIETELAAARERLLALARVELALAPATAGDTP